MSKHTPGPWAISADDRPGMEWNNHIVAAAQPWFTICFMSHDGDGINEQGEANVRLIAAAPDLLHALRAWTMAANGDGINKHNLVTLVKLSESVIAKATS